ncbi:ABC transporter ATP-binding protein [Paenibacillus sp. IITD108]|uniref:ABC transporter ATP-binding protein n=1 Tax=Paenibacillus sp. IITD108 TaxID=3116649 RepID=UPI002F3FF9CE
MLEKLLEVKELQVQFERNDTIVKAVNGISFDVYKKEIVGIVGESGSGKSVCVKALMGLIPKSGKIVSGSATFMGYDLLSLTAKEQQSIRGKDIGFIFQDPMSSLNPTLPIGKQIMEPILWHKLTGRSAAKEHTIQLLKRVGIPSPELRMKQYPFEFSGGMRQRAVIAMAIACSPKLLIADEPTTALDVTVQAQIMELISSMRDELGMSVVIITHDFGVAAQYCDRILVMYAGKIVESASINQFLSAPRHPYSKALLKSTPVLGVRKSPEPINGTPPNMSDDMQGCAFASRCNHVTSACIASPELTGVGDNHYAACWNMDKEGDDNAATA